MTRPSGPSVGEASAFLLRASSCSESGTQSWGACWQHLLYSLRAWENQISGHIGTLAGSGDTGGGSGASGVSSPGMHLVGRVVKARRGRHTASLGGLRASTRLAGSQHEPRAAGAAQDGPPLTSAAPSFALVPTPVRFQGNSSDNDVRRWWYSASIQLLNSSCEPHTC